MKLRISNGMLYFEAVIPFWNRSMRNVVQRIDERMDMIRPTAAAYEATWMDPAVDPDCWASIGAAIEGITEPNSIVGDWRIK